MAMERYSEGFSRLLTRLFGSRNERLIRSLLPACETIAALEPRFARIADEALRRAVDDFRERIEKGKDAEGFHRLIAEAGDLARNDRGEEAIEVRKRAWAARRRVLDGLLPEVFAATREAGKRALGMRHFDVQILGGMILHQGKIAEMVTGEGKTLVATLAASLNAIDRVGVHVVTVNDYLARRDRDWMAPLFEALGLSVGAIQQHMHSRQRQREYACDITYGTNNEFGFDYLRDNMKLSLADQCQRELVYAVVDEVDSILIDEARTPLIISGPAEQATDMYYRADEVVRQLEGVTKTELDRRTRAGEEREDIEQGCDYIWSEKEHQVFLTERGIERSQRLLRVEDFFSAGNMDWPHFLEQGLKAHKLYQLDHQYIVKDGEVVIVDEHTGRLMPGRVWSDGLHQAVSAKEGLRIKEETQTLATITFQNFFRLYHKIAGMTGTAMTEAAEFDKIYKLDVVTMPTNRPLKRFNYPDAVYRTEREKLAAIADRIETIHAIGRPCLVGTISIEKSERLSEILSRRGVPHEVLNAKHHEREASIVAKAGQLGMVTIATNMAGRGTDIVLGTYTREDLLEHWKKTGLAPSHSSAGDPDLLDGLEEHWNESGPVVSRPLQRVLGRDEASMLEIWDAFGLAQSWPEGGKTRNGIPLVTSVAEMGGLHILGTERHEARRIDNQLRGRCGRQGDPGSSIFYLSLEDDLMRIFAADWVSGFLQRLGMEEGDEIASPMVSRAIERAQKKVEERNFDARKNLLEYDGVMDEQRKLVYENRQTVLRGENTRNLVFRMIRESLQILIDTHLDPHMAKEGRDPEAISRWAARKFETAIEPASLDGLEPEDVQARVMALVDETYRAREQEEGEEGMRRLEGFVLLAKIDERWKDHLHAMDILRHGIGYRGWAGTDPKIAYKKEGYDMFRQMIEGIQEEVTDLILRVRLRRDEGPRDVWGGAGEAASGDGSGAGDGDAAAAGLGSAMSARRANRAAADATYARAPRQIRRDAPKVGRNDPCPCGSGKKYKKCHGTRGG